MKIFALIAWGVLLPVALWLGLVALSHHGVASRSGLAEWIAFGVISLIGNAVCFRFPVPRVWRAIAFIIYLPLIGYVIFICGFLFDCLVLHNCP